MSTRRAVERLLELTIDSDCGGDDLDDYLDDTARELLLILCSNLALASAGLRGKSRRKCEMRERAQEYAAGIGAVLDAWRCSDIEVIDGPRLADSSLGATLMD